MRADRQALDIAVVGLGQAGGNLAAELARRGYSALALNTASTDLAALSADGRRPSLPEDRRLYIGQEGYDGAGADPEYGRACVEANAETIRARLAQLAEGADVLLLAAGLGGGTGSALQALFSLLDESFPPSVAMITLPTDAEAGLTKVNAIRALSGLLDAPLDGWILVDNARLAEDNPKLSLSDFFPEVNAKIAAPLDALNHLNTRDELTAIRAFDGEDLRRLLLSGGLISYAQLEIDKLSAQAVFAGVSDWLIEGGIGPAGFKLEQLSHLGLVIEAPEEQLAACPTVTFEQLKEALKSETGGGTVIQGVYSNREPGPVRLHVLAIARGLPTRVERLLGEAQQEGRQLIEKETAPIPGIALGELQSLELATPRRTGRRHQVRRTPSLSQQTTSLSERLPTSPGTARLPRRHQTLRRSPAISRDLPPVAEELVHTDRRPDDPHTEDTVPGQTMRRPRPALPAPDAATGELPSPAFYAQLVHDFSAADEAGRQEIIERLEDDSVADPAAVRYYAVEAMLQIGRETFAEALFAATSDMDEAVRTLAQRGLDG